MFPSSNQFTTYQAMLKAREHINNNKHLINFLIQAAAAKDPSNSYELCPRAKIFRRDAAKVVKFAEFQDILRYNDFQHDEYADGNPWNAICSRGDLASENPSPSGCKWIWRFIKADKVFKVTIQK